MRNPLRLGYRAQMPGMEEKASTVAISWGRIVGGEAKGWLGLASAGLAAAGSCRG